MQKRKIFTAFIAVVLMGCASTSAQSQSREEGQISVQVLGFDAGKINTRGWADSPYVTPDGRYLFFMYSRYNFMRSILFKLPPNKVGGMRAGHKPNDINAYDDSDIYFSERMPDRRWGKPQALSNVNDDKGDCCMVFSEDLSLMFYAKHSEANGSQDIAYKVRQDTLPLAESKWSDTVFLDNSINSSSHEDNPHICVRKDGAIDLWYTSWRNEGSGGKDIYYSLYANNVWQPAQNIGSSINTEKNEDQFFVNCSTGDAYFNRGDMIMTTKFLGDTSSYADPREIDVGYGFAAEASLLQNGSELFFATGSIKDMSIKIMRSERQPDGTWSKAQPVD